MLNKVDKIYICHYTKLVERKPIVIEQLSKYNLDVEWVTSYDKEDLNIDDISKELVNIKKPLSIKEFGGIHNSRTLRLSELSLTLKHRYIWEQMVLNDIDSCLVLEDDILFSDDFVNRFNNQISELSDTYDLVWVGSCCNLHVPSVDGKFLYETSIGSRCTHAYLISKKCAEKMLEFIKTSNYPVDFMFRSAIKDYGLENYWMEPDLISQNPKWGTTIQNDSQFL